MAYKYSKAMFVLLLFFSLIWSQDIRADQGYYFKQISLNEGLSQSTVRCILNDRNGFVWIGTKSGLNRFDRYSLKSYVYKKNDSKSIPGNQINFILEDKTGNIWIGTENGLALYNPDTDNFEAIKYQKKPLVVRSAVELPTGVIFGGEGNIYKFSFAKKQIQLMPNSTKEKSTEMFTGMKLWHHQQVLLYTRRNGVWIFNPTDKSINPVPFIKEREIMALYVDPKQQVWIASYGQGIKAYDKSGKQLFHYDSQNSGLSNDVVLDILERKGKLWIATDGGGINILDLNSRSFTALKHIPGNSSSLPENSILTLYHDHEDNLWAGSIRGGLISIRKAFFNTYKDGPLNGIYGLSEKTVLSLYEEKTGVLWIGTDGGGINRFDPDKMVFKHYLPTYGLKIASITSFSDQELLISAFSKGLFLFNKVSGAIQPFHNNKINSQGEIIKSSGIAVNVNRISQDYLYLFASQAFQYHIPSQKFTVANYHSGQNTHSPLLKIFSDAARTYLFGPYGIFELNHAQNRIKNIVHIQPNGNPITAAGRDKQGVFWIGNRDGLMRYDPKQRLLKKIKTSLFNEVSTLVADSTGRLWIGAQNMVFLYLIEENKFLAFGESDGVVPNEFLYKPSLVAANGDIYLGGVRGLLHIKKNIPAITADAPVIELMGMELNGIPLVINRLDKSNWVSIPWNQSSLVIRIMAREKDVFRKKMFRFKITGLDEQIIETYDHSLAIGSLPTGNYKILVSCGLKNGGWSKFSAVLNISVTPPWYRSLWFIGLVLITTAGLIGIFYRMAIAKKERKLQWDMKALEQKTDEAKIRFLIHISHELRTPLTLIYSPLQRMLSNKNLDQDLNKKLRGVYKQASHMKEIIDMVLDVRKIELGQEQLKLSRQNLNQWIRKIADNFSNEFEAKGIRTEYQLEDSIGEIAFDEKKCELILSNLLVNALKFSNADSILTISSSAKADFIRIAVIDEGIGLEHVDTSQLFKPFYQGTHQHHGTGIGLSFSKILVELHGGHIGAEKNSKQGATFYFELPVQLESQKESPGRSLTKNSLIPASISEPEASRQHKNFPTTGYSLLIVEDEPELRLFLLESLKPYFSALFEAEQGLQALELIKTQHPDIILSDVMMPGMDGFALCQLIKEDISISHIPIVLLTTQSDAESRNLGYKLGADAYISKPFELDFLQTILANLLKNREALKAKYKKSSLFIPVEEGTYSSADESFMRKLNELITHNLDNEQLQVDFLTDKMAMSRASLYSKLKSIADIGVNDYINKFRLEKAAYLLSHSDLAIMEIADTVGFANQRYFSTVFKQFYHTSPTLYRKNSKAKSGV
ncbi:response regulator [Pedobacter sp. N36a]|uniref:two-component regulator propeller domain-containing protein n=1 Tax=Pedobacter sp. N36a TaxID=2767996 RepID=UPI001656BCF6|nr:two-component regulator propeller domain-containing protein [Pedobacter sp. N36a]MBC8987998.1 response regulator [Pedobacter sp. N36a]